MTAIAVERFQPVTLGQPVWHPGPAAELLRDAFDPDSTTLEWLRKDIVAARRAFDRILLMASGKSNYREDKVTNALLNAAAFGTPANVFFGLWTTAVATDHDASHGGTAGEVASAGAYDRVQKATNTTNFATVAGTSIKNSTAIAFPTASANWNSGNNLNQVLAFDGNAKTSGDNLELWGDLTTPKPVLSGDTASFAVNGFTYAEN